MNSANLDAASLLNALPAGVVVHATDTRFLYANPIALKILRLSQEQILGKDAMDPYWQFVDRFKCPLPVHAYPVNRVLASNAAVADYVLGVMDGSRSSVTWVMANAYPERDAQGAVERVVVTFVDISQTHNEIPFESIVELANDVIVITTADPLEPQIVYVNQAFSQLTGYTATEVIGQTPRFLQRSETDPETRARIRQALSEGKAIQETILNFHKNGTRYWLDMNIVPLFNDRGALTYFAAIERDVTSLKEKEKNLLSLAEHDPLTELLNRRGFTEIANKVFMDCTGRATGLVLGMLDIDHFKRINDTYGHEVGDQALQHFSALVRTGFRSSDVAARFGGEEFTVLLSALDEAEGLRILNQFREKVAATPMSLDNGEALHLTVSIGLTAHKAASLADMLKRADAAMYEAKRNGRNRVVVG